jgi:protein-S-isoprenylcysteine O-methyltransferase Ste14
MASRVFRYGIVIAVLAGLLFLSAGSVDYWQGWVFFASIVATLVVSGWLMKGNMALAAERLRPGKGMKWWDKAYFLAATPLNFGAVVVAAMDAGRLHLSRRPALPVYALVLAVFVVGQGLFLWAKKVNPFFSSVARIQHDRGQSVCREGPYRFCRHPGYLGGLMFGLATPVVLGSYWALIPQGLAALLLLGRTALEDRMLKKDLLWYAEYAESVPAKLFPGVW